MDRLRVRAMSEDEYASWQDRAMSEYAAEHVGAGTWTEQEALERARAEHAVLLPRGQATDGMVFLVAELPGGERAGRAWLSLHHPRGIANCAFLYDIEVDEAHRGRGLGRALLAAVEDVVASHGVSDLMLNVFRTNERAIALYQAAGYQVVTQQMRRSVS